jgi:type III secretory pathway component EscS
MEAIINVLSWSPNLAGPGAVDLSVPVIIVMSFIGASVITRLVNINTSFNFSVNFLVMLAGCFAMHQWVGENVIPVGNDLLASAVTANFGMTMAGFALLFSYRNSV